jgi:hypothetical protein
VAADTATDAIGRAAPDNRRADSDNWITTASFRERRSPSRHCRRAGNLVRRKTALGATGPPDSTYGPRNTEDGWAIAANAWVRTAGALAQDEGDLPSATT